MINIFLNFVIFFLVVVVLNDNFILFLIDLFDNFIVVNILFNLLCLDE